MWLEGFASALSGMNLLWLFLGSAIGLVVGVLPVLGANFGVALMLPFTFGMDAASAIIMLCAIHAACNYGDSITSILLNIPGSPCTVASCWDGYPLAQQGRGGEAIGIATFSSFLGGVAVWLLLALLVAPLAKFAIAFGAPEYCVLMFMALGLVSVAAKGETLKGLIMVCLGLTVAEIGQDEVIGTTYRFTYGVPWLEAGIPMVVSTLGIFSIPQVIDMLEEGGTVAKCVVAKDSILKGFIAPLRRPLTMLRAAGIGAFVGVLPALGVPFAGITAYLTEKKYSKEAAQFGKGAPAGLVAAEMGKGSCVVGDLIPTFTLGIPGSVTGAIIMAALILQGVEPGPRFLLSGKLPYTIFAGLLLAQATFLITGLMVGKQLGRIAYIPNTLLSPLLIVLVFLGAYATQNSSFDMLVALVFGLFAYVLVKLGYPVVCMVLGIILGPLLEGNFHRALGESLGSYAVFITRPVTLAMLVITVLFLIGPYLLHLSRRFRKQPPTIFEEALESEAQKGETKSELIVLLFGGFIFSVFLYTARHYSPLVRLFPVIVCSAGLGFIVWRLLVIVIHVSSEGGWRDASSTPAIPFTFFGGRLSWQWSIASMLAYVFLIFVFGFVISSAVYIAGIFVMTGGYRKWGRAILAAALVGLGILIMAKLTHLLLPVGLLTGV